MAYTILNTDGTTLLLLADGQVDKTTTSLTLIGRNHPSYGEDLNNNFIKLLANSANTSGSPPRSPLTGQLWYDTTERRLKIYDNGFKTIGAVQISTTQPTGLRSGDLWFDSTTSQLKLYSSGVLYTVGPSIPVSIGSSGITLPATNIKDIDSTAKNVLLLRSYGTTMGLLYYDTTDNNQPFNMDPTDKQTYMPAATTSTVVSGVTIINDLNVFGKLTNDYLSLAVDIDILTPSKPNILGFEPGGDATTQNNAISNVLTQMFPPNATTQTNTSTIMRGLLLGTQARVICKYSNVLGVSQTGYQVRVFRTVGTYATATWSPFMFTTDVLQKYNPASSSSTVAVNYISTSTN